MSRFRPNRRWGAPALVVAFAFALALPGLTGNSSDTEPSSPDRLAPGEAGLRAAIDPETGELVVGTGAAGQPAGKAVDAGIEQMLSRSSEGLVKEALPGGGYRVDLQGRFMNLSVARVGEDGCVHHHGGLAVLREATGSRGQQQPVAAREAVLNDD